MNQPILQHAALGSFETRIMNYVCLIVAVSDGSNSILFIVLMYQCDWMITILMDFNVLQNISKNIMPKKHDSTNLTEHSL